MLLKTIRPRWSADGRGKHYTLLRALIESTLRVAYVGGWPARLWEKVPGACDVQVVRHTLHLLGREARPLRVVFASDLHFGPTTPLRTIETAFERIESERPDVLLLGGDFVFLDLDEVAADALRKLTSALSAPVKLAVLGNHDLWTDTAPIERALAAGGVRVLVNDAVRLPAPFEDVAVLGLDDPWTGSADPTRALAACGDARVRIGLSHSPDGAEFLREDSVALLFCGHTHGGQIAMPGGRPIVLPPGPYSKRFSSGLHRVHDFQIYVSRGIGTTEVPVRLHAPPEIAVFEIY